jgi:23S rRNA (uridine2552-2'-O)-methyltransferase
MANYEKPDTWSIKAQKEGYPARSVYKLKEMDEKFHLIPGDSNRLDGSHLSDGNRLASVAKFRALDLGAAPGSWSLYTLRKLSGAGFLAAADLSPLSRQYDRGLFEGANFYFVRGDITQAEIRDALLGKGPYALLISDAAPATTGNRSVDTLRSLGLAEAVLDYAEAALQKGGNMAVKVFQGGDTAGILKKIRELFDTGRAFKPAACRRESFETYYLGLGRK